MGEIKPLEEIANKERLNMTSKNGYSHTNEYNSLNKNALSDGDEKGKGELNNVIGSLTDINTRKDNIVKNEYNSNNEYNSLNKNALSDGDEKGKGELDKSIGSLSDINNRNNSIVKNKYNEGKFYPDFTI